MHQTGQQSFSSLVCPLQRPLSELVAPGWELRGREADSEGKHDGGDIQAEGGAEGEGERLLQTSMLAALLHRFTNVARLSSASNVVLTPLASVILLRFVQEPPQGSHIAWL